MVKRMIISVILIISPLILVTKGQNKDSLNCRDDYNKIVPKDILLPRWTRAPILKESNIPILGHLCEIISMRSYEKTPVAFLLIDEMGNPYCISINFNLNNDSLNIKVMDLLYSIKFEPAMISENTSTKSYFNLILNKIKCEGYHLINQKRIEEKDEN